MGISIKTKVQKLRKKGLQRASEGATKKGGQGGHHIYIRFSDNT